MQRIDGPTRSATLPAPSAVGTGSSSPGYFAGGDPAAQVAPTIISPDWANAIQEELIAVIDAAGLAPSKTDLTQLLQAIQKVAGGTLLAEPNGYIIHPSGLIEQWGITPIPPGSNLAQFDIAFPMQFPHEIWNISGNASQGANANWHPMSIVFPNVALNAATAQADSCNSSQTIATGSNLYWRALGR